MKLRTLLRRFIRAKSFPMSSREKQPPGEQKWNVKKDALYCRYSFCSLILSSFSPPFLIAGILYLMLAVILIGSGGLDLPFSRFTLFLATGGCIIPALISGFFIYRNKSSERLYFDTRGVTLFKGEQFQWQCAYQEISRAKVVAAHSAGEENPQPLGRLYLKSRKEITIPWGMHRSTPPVSRTSRPRLYLPFELLRRRGIKVEFKKSMVRERLFNQSILAIAGLMLLVAAAALSSHLYIKGKSDSLLVFDGRAVKSFTPWFRLHPVSFKSITAGSDNMIYLGTENSGVLRFNGKTFKSTGPGLPPKAVKYLFFDYTQDRLLAVIAAETWPHEGIAVYCLEQGKWSPLAPKILQEKKIYYLEFHNGEMLVSTDKGLYRFFNYRQSDSCEIYFKDRQVVSTFSLSGTLYVLTKRTTEKGFYYQTLYRRRSGDPDDWEEVFKDITIIDNIVTCDKWGSIWYAKNAYSLANPQSGDVYYYRHPGTSRMPVFQKALVINGDIYLGVVLSTYATIDESEDTRKIIEDIRKRKTIEDTRKIVEDIIKRKAIEDIRKIEKKEKRWAVVMFDPGEKPCFVPIFDKIPFKTEDDIDFTFDRQGNIWAISD